MGVATPDEIWSTELPVSPLPLHRKLDRLRKDNPRSGRTPAAPRTKVEARKRTQDDVESREPRSVLR
jgi:hypothetical protein